MSNHSLGIKTLIITHYYGDISCEVASGDKSKWQPIAISYAGA